MEKIKEPLLRTKIERTYNLMKRDQTIALMRMHYCLIALYERLYGPYKGE